MDRMTFTHAVMNTPDRDHPTLTRADVIEHGTVTTLEILHDPAEFIARGVFSDFEALYPSTTLAAWYVKCLLAWVREDMTARYGDRFGFAVHRDKTAVTCVSHIWNDFGRDEERFLILYFDRIDGVHYSFARYADWLASAILDGAVDAVIQTRYTEYWEPMTDEIAHLMPPGQVFHCSRCELGWVSLSTDPA